MDGDGPRTDAAGGAQAGAPDLDACVSDLNAGAAEVAAGAGADDDADDDDDAATAPGVTMLDKWNMAHFLPRELAVAFRNCVMNFVCTPHREYLEAAAPARGASARGEQRGDEDTGDEAETRDADGGDDDERLDTPAGRMRTHGARSASLTPLLTVDERAATIFEKSLKPMLYELVPAIENNMATLQQADGACATLVCSRAAFQIVPTPF